MMKIGLVGRTNVGKSTLFNRLLGSFRAIVTNIPGTTRDIIQEYFEKDNIKGILLDSPGLDKFEDEKEKIKDIIQQSDILLFVVDGKQGLHPQDEEIFSLINKYRKKDKTILVVNKVDGKVYTDESINIVSDFYKFGLENVVPISAKQYEGLDELIDTIEKFKIDSDYIYGEEGIGFAILGRPNVGKSTLLNKICGEELSKVSEESGTTLDYISCEIDYKGKKIKLYDTAGIRKKGKIHGLEKIAYEKTINMLKYKKPVVLLLIDAVEGLVHRDLTLLQDILKLNLPVIIAINKIDEISKEDEKRFMKLISAKLNFAKWIPIIPISAKEGINLPKLFEWIDILQKEYNKKISTSVLNQVLRNKRIENPPRFPKNKICKFYYITQIGVAPPRFKVFINSKDKLNFALVRWIENVIRQNFGFIGSPIVLEFEDKNKDNYI